MTLADALGKVVLDPVAIALMGDQSAKVSGSVP